LLPLVLVAGLIALLALPLPPTPEPAAMETPLRAWLELGAGAVAAAAELAAALVIGFGVARALAALASAARRARPGAIRAELGRMLALGLELTIASDILRTAVAPTRAEIASLAAIVLLRTLLDQFLVREADAASL
jgi:uncharacterized membrane protein